MKRRVLQIFFIIGALTTASILMISPPEFAHADAPLPPSESAGWLETLNYYRVSSGVKPVIENAALTLGALKHATYLAKTDPALFTGAYVSAHTENPASPYYSLQGANSGTNVAGCESESNCIDRWMAAPFHAIGLLRDNLKSSGFAMAQDHLQMWSDATLDVIHGLIGPRSKVITFPGNGATSRLDSFTGEAPDPRESCGTDWKNFNGLPLWVSLLSAPPQTVSASISTPSGKTLSKLEDVCIVDEWNYTTSNSIVGQNGRALIRTDHLVIVIPKNKLDSGSYSVSIQGKGMTKIAWSFNVISALPDVSLDLRSLATRTITWTPIPSPTSNPIVGYQIKLVNRANDVTQIFDATVPNFDTSSIAQGDYWVCVNAIGKIHSGSCPNLWSYSISSKPTTDKPTTDKPTTDKPTTDKPTTDKPTTDKPTTDKPTTDKPTTDKPTTDKPTTDKPTTDNAELPKKIAITCVKGKTAKKVTAANPKCPVGYKI